jgi:general secretion pathway protein I
LSAQRPRGFTLLEVLVAIAILGLGMTAILSAQTGLFASSSYAEKISLASGMVRCRLSELELKLNKEGYPLTDQKDEGNCCNDEVPPPGYKCKWKIEKIELPLPPTATELSNQMSASGISSTLGALGSMSGFGSSGSSPLGGAGLGDLSKVLSTPGGVPGGALSGLPGLGGGTPGSPAPTDSSSFGTTPFGQSSFGSSQFGSTVPGTVPLGSSMPDQTALATGSPFGGGVSALAPMAMSMVYPTLKPMLEASIRKVTVTVEWQGGGKGKSLDVVEYVTNPMQGGLDPNAANGLDTAMGALQQMLGIPTSGTGTTGTGTAPAATSPSTPSIFGGLH